jgi:hypothetical protein
MNGMITLHIEYPVLTLLVTLMFASIHLLGPRMDFLQSAPRRVWLSAAGGISIAYVFVHILPELAHHQKNFDQGGPFGFLDGSERHVYFMALLGLACFYGLELAVRASARRHARLDGGQSISAPIFWLQLGSFALFNFIIGYLLVDREETGLLNLATYAVAMAMHFIVTDQGLRQQSHPQYDVTGRWILAAAVVGGFVLGLSVTFRPAVISGLFAFLAGGIILNVLKHELPEDRKSNFVAFFLGTGLYAAILLGTH